MQCKSLAVMILVAEVEASKAGQMVCGELRVFQRGTALLALVILLVNRGCVLPISRVGGGGVRKDGNCL